MTQFKKRFFGGFSSILPEVYVGKYVVEIVDLVVSRLMYLSLSDQALPESGLVRASWSYSRRPCSRRRQRQRSLLTQSGRSGPEWTARPWQSLW
jgi:hypothetical protein